jgi:hypothetical protein
MVFFKKWFNFEYFVIHNVFPFGGMVQVSSGHDAYNE